MSYFFDTILSDPSFSMASLADLAGPTDGKTRSKIIDGRVVDVATGSKLNDRNKLGADVDHDLVSEIVGKAKKNGVDPFTALAIGLQETGLSYPKPNKYFPDPSKVANPFMVSSKDEMNGKVPIGEWREKTGGNLVDAFMELFKSKQQYAKKLGKKSEEDVIQAWNGYGKVDGLYGLKGMIDMNSNPVYGKRVVDVRENIIKKNKWIVDLVNSSQK